MNRIIKYITIVLILSTTLAVLAGCQTAKPPSSVVQNVTAAEARNLVNENSGNTNFVILDVRTPTEFAEGHMANAINVDQEAADFTDKIQALDKTRTYLVYCRSGRRSQLATEAMIGKGFTRVYNMLNGMNDWQAAGYPVVK
ncbi:MAG: rhodanese-like domain-containing protein [Dehalococcoidales bacterium]|nr:rhodanese-like domain-containing protein [Dehalococcoidales bacterium]